jgi:hypothetical protein
MRLRIHESALKHGYTREEISYALDFLMYEELVDSENDPPKWLFIGPQDDSGFPLELFGGDLDDDVLLIWHAMACRDEYLERMVEAGEDA